MDRQIRKRAGTAKESSAARVLSKPIVGCAYTFSCLKRRICGHTFSPDSVYYFPLATTNKKNGNFRINIYSFFFQTANRFFLTRIRRNRSLRVNFPIFISNRRRTSAGWPLCIRSHERTVTRFIVIHLARHSPRSPTPTHPVAYVFHLPSSIGSRIDAIPTKQFVYDRFTFLFRRFRFRYARK